MKYSVLIVDTGKELATFSIKEEAIQYCKDNNLEAIRVGTEGETTLLRPPFQDNTDLVLYVLPSCK